MLEAANRYENEQEGLGSQFTDEVEAVVQKILGQPAALASTP